MGIQIDKKKALEILEEQAVNEANGEPVPSDWEQGVGKLSTACESSSRTHIAFLGTALLAKATDARADAFSVKARAETPGAYSTRTFGKVLFQNSIRLGIHLGVTGREPLNNQPYLGIERADWESISSHLLASAKKTVRILIELLEELDQLDEQKAKLALCAFIRVRRQYFPDYQPAVESGIGADVTSLVNAVIEFSQESEGGKLVQAVAAGVLDACTGSSENVVSGKIHDPDRNLPGDIGVLGLAPVFDPEDYCWMFEVRHKPVSEGDAFHFAQKCADAGVIRGSVLALHPEQENTDFSPVITWAEERGITLVVIVGWEAFIRQAVYWSWAKPTTVVEHAFDHIRTRLIEIEASVDALTNWNSILSGK